MRRFLLSIGVLTTLYIAPAFGQILTVTSPQPAAPGSIVNVTLTNNTLNGISYVGQPLAMLTETGTLVQPLQFFGDIAFFILPGSTVNLGLVAPMTGAGSDGSFVLLFSSLIGAGRAVTRLDVGSADPQFPTLHAWPARTPFMFSTHELDFSTPTKAEWEFGNVGGGPHTFSSGDTLDMFTPGGTTPVASTSLAGLTVNAGLTVRVNVPVTGLTPGPYTITTFYADTAAGLPVFRSHGVQPLGTPNPIDLHLTTGHKVSLNDGAEAFLAFAGFTPNSPPLYFFVAAIQPGTLALPGATAPFIASDPIVLASLQDGVGGLLANNIGTPTPFISPPLPFNLGNYFEPSVGIVHPGPAFSGVSFRVAAVAFDSNAGDFGASQSETLTLE